MTKTISKNELLEMLNNIIPDGARIAATSSLGGGIHEVDEDNLRFTIAPIDDVYDVCDEDDIDEDELSDTTHLIMGV